MNFLNRAYAQAGELFRGMTPGARITAGMLMVTIVVSLIYLFMFQVHTADKYLYGGQEFTREELNNIQSAFAAENLDDYQPDGHRIRVPNHRYSDYVQALIKADFLPENWDSSIDQALNSTNAFFESKHLTDMKMNHAIQQKLAQVISDHAEIDRATVQYREVNQGGWPQVVERKATVVVSGKSNRKITPAMVNVIRATASGWFGIRPEDVMVTDLNGTAYPPPEIDGLGKDTKLYAEMKQLYEEQWKQKICDCLSVYPGIVVGVNVEMDPDVINESTKIVVDPQPTALKSESFSRTQESRPSVGGQPGAEPNEVPSNRPRDIQTVVNQETSSDESREEQLNVTGHEQTNRKKAPLVPTYATATVSVPKSYFTRLWKQRNPTPEGEEPKDPPGVEVQNIETEIIEQIKEKVVRTLPRREAGEDPFPQVEVSSYADFPLEPFEPPPLTATTLAWLSMNWQKLGLLGVGLISLLILRGMIRAGLPTAQTPAPAIAPRIAADDETEEEPAEMPAVLHRRVTSTGSTLREELTAMVREDPDAAANVLRTWIGDAA